MSDTIYRQAAIDAVMDTKPIVFDVNRLEPHQRTKDVVKALEQLPSAQPDIIRCRDCQHKPYPSDNYDHDNSDCGFEIIFPDYRCPCRCDDEYYNYIPDDDWFCGNAERKNDG